MNFIFDNIVGIIGILIGGIIGYYFYNKGKVFAHITCSYKGKILIKKLDSKNNDISILYKEKTVDRVQHFEIALWNNGKRTIEKSNVKKPLSIIFPNTSKILDQKLTQISSEFADIKVEKIEDNIITIFFNYLDYQQGFFLDVYADNTNDSLRKSDRLKVDIEYTGLKKPTKYIYNIYKKPILKENRNLSFYNIMASSLFLGWTLSGWFESDFEKFDYLGMSLAVFFILNYFRDYLINFWKYKIYGTPSMMRMSNVEERNV